MACGMDTAGSSGAVSGWRDRAAASGHVVSADFRSFVQRTGDGVEGVLRDRSRVGGTADGVVSGGLRNDRQTQPVRAWDAGVRCRPQGPLSSYELATAA